MLARLRSVWRNLRHRDSVDRDLDDEVRAVFDILVDEKRRGGMTAEQARRAATLELGRQHAITQQVREERAGASLDAVIKDIRYGARMLRANPGFTLVVVLSLAAGIGANSAIFSIANAMLLKTLPIAEPQNVHVMRFESRLPMTGRVSYVFFDRLRSGFPTRDGLAGMSRVTRMRMGSGGDAQMAAVQLVTGEFFGVLGTAPQLGRMLTPDDNRTMGAHPVTVISDAFWRSRFNAAPDVVGREVTFNNVRFTIVGVAPPGFSGVWLESPAEAWIPVMMQADVKYTQNFSAENADFLKPWIPQDGMRWLDVLTRSADPAHAEAALNAAYRPELLAEVDRITDVQQRAVALDRRIVLEPFGSGFSNLRSQFRAPLFALLGMVGLLLLIACANTANLLLARSTSRQREMAVRLSIGASRGRIIGQLLIESLLLGALAAAVGLAIAPLVSELLVRMTIGVESGPLPFSVGIDSRVVMFTIVITLLTSFLFGFAPAWRATDLSLSTALKSTGRSTHQGARLNLSKMLVVGQVALSLFLAVGAGLFARSFNNLVSQPLGVEDQVLSVTINPNLGGYQLPELASLYQRIIERVEAIPGVQSATIAMCGVMTGCRSNSDGIQITGYVPQPGEQLMFQENRVGPNYFSTVGMTMAAGRGFEPREIGSDAAVAVINETMARKYFNGRDPIGQRFGYDHPNEFEIIGVVRDARVNTVREAVFPMVFHKIGATPSYVGTMQVRAAGDPALAGAAIRRALNELEPRLPVDRITTIGALAANTLRQERLIARLTTVVGILALALASLGLYGLMAYAVKQRTAELGVRFALGAPRPRVMWMVFRESLLLVGAGLAIGVPLVLAAARLIGPMLFDVNPNDPAVMVIAMAVLAAVGAWSGYLPAWRASRVDPLVALREE
ncbi:MAG TPA: ABC transporter permease [Vicinamibacterales bacterium]